MVLEESWSWFGTYTMKWGQKDREVLGGGHPFPTHILWST